MMYGWLSFNKVSRLEFLRLWMHPLTPALIVLLVLSAALHGFAAPAEQGGVPTEEGLLALVGESFWFVAVYFGIVSMFVGVTSIAEERRNHAINVLQPKPLYRRDVVLGKVFGLNAYMLLIIVFAMVSTTAALMIFYKMPNNLSDFMVRLLIYIFLLSLYSSMNVAIAMLMGIVFKNLLLAAAMASAFIYFDWYYNIFAIIPGLSNFDPQIALADFYANSQASLMNGATTVSQWISVNAANLFFFTAAIIILLLVCTAAYTMEDIK